MQCGASGRSLQVFSCRRSHDYVVVANRGSLVAGEILTFRSHPERGYQDVPNARTRESGNSLKISFLSVPLPSFCPSLEISCGLPDEQNPSPSSESERRQLRKIN